MGIVTGDERVRRGLLQACLVHTILVLWVELDCLASVVNQNLTKSLCSCVGRSCLWIRLVDPVLHEAGGLETAAGRIETRTLRGPHLPG